MSDFNYQEYLKNNPLLKEEIKDQLIAESQLIQNEGVAEEEKTISEDTFGPDGYTIIELIKDRALNNDSSEIDEAMEVMEFIGEHYGIDFDFGRHTMKEEYSEFKNYDDIIGGIHVRFGALEDYVQENEPSAMDDLQRIIAMFNTFDEKMAYDDHMELEEDTFDKPGECPKGGKHNYKKISSDGTGECTKCGLRNSFSQSEGALEEVEEVEEVSSSKMKVSELKAKIKEDIISLLAEQDEEEEVEVEDEVKLEADPEDLPDLDAADSQEGLTADEKEIQDSLKIAYDNAVSIGDTKLADQIGNSITFFTRTHVVER